MRCSGPRHCRRSPPDARTFDSSSTGSGRDAAAERFRLRGWPSSAPRTASPPGRLPTSTAFSSPPSCTTSAEFVLMHAYPGYPKQISRTRPARPRSACTTSAAVSASTTRWSTTCSTPALEPTSRSPPRSSAVAPTMRVAMPPLSASPTCSPTTPRASPYFQRSSCCAPRVRSGSRPLRAGLRLLYDLPYPSFQRPRSTEAITALQPLESSSSWPRVSSTSRSPAEPRSPPEPPSHGTLQDVYGRLGAVDRAQAVLTPPSAAGCQPAAPPARPDPPPPRRWPRPTASRAGPRRTTRGTRRSPAHSSVIAMAGPG